MALALALAEGLGVRVGKTKTEATGTLTPAWLLQPTVASKKRKSCNQTSGRMCAIRNLTPTMAPVTAG